MEGRASIDFWSMRSGLVEKHMAGSIVWPLILSYRVRDFEGSGAPWKARGKVFSLAPGLGLEVKSEAGDSFPGPFFLNLFREWHLH